MAYPYNEILLYCDKKGIDYWHMNNMDESQKDHAQWKKPDRKF